MTMAIFPFGIEGMLATEVIRLMTVRAVSDSMLRSVQAYNPSKLWHLCTISPQLHPTLATIRRLYKLPTAHLPRNTFRNTGRFAHWPRMPCLSFPAKPQFSLSHKLLKPTIPFGCCGLSCNAYSYIIISFSPSFKEESSYIIPFDYQMKAIACGHSKNYGSEIECYGKQVAHILFPYHEKQNR